MPSKSAAAGLFSLKLNPRLTRFARIQDFQI
jgi:hypothetical protein